MQKMKQSPTKAKGIPPGLKGKTMPAGIKGMPPKMPGKGMPAMKSGGMVKGKKGC